MAAEVERQADARRDFLAPTSQVRMVTEQEAARQARSTNTPPNVRLQLSKEHFGINRLAHNQIAQRLSIPQKYYDRMAQDAPELLTTNVNHWFDEQNEARMIRTLDGNVRAFLSDRYRTIDNYDLMAAVLPILSAQKALKVVSCEVTERRLYIKAVNQRVEGEIKKGDPVQAGIVFSNSEVGAGTMKVEQLVYRLVCLNGMIAGSMLRKMHLGRAQGASDEAGAWELFSDDTKEQSDKALFMQVEDVTRRVLTDQDWFTGSLKKMQDATQRKLEGDPLKAVEELQKVTRVSDATRGGIMRHLIEGGDLSQWGMVNAITRHSQDVDSYDEATELEMLGGRVLELPQSQWKRIATAS